MSYNSLKADDCSVIKEGLDENNSILGLHMVGNEFDTDAQGFIRPDSDVNPATHHIMTKILPNLETGVVKPSKAGLNATSNCWICEGWTQVTFRFTPPDG